MAASIQNKSICPECGEFTGRLNERTGWCISCTRSIESINRSEVEGFLLTHADHIEHYMMQGKSLNQAIDLMRAEVARYRTCICCGGFLRRAGRHAVFCRKKPKCRQLSRQYVYLYQRKGLTKAEALSQVLTTINGS